MEEKVHKNLSHRPQSRFSRRSQREAAGSGVSCPCLGSRVAAETAGGPDGRSTGEFRDRGSCLNSRAPGFHQRNWNKEFLRMFMALS